MKFPADVSSCILYLNRNYSMNEYLEIYNPQRKQTYIELKIEKNTVWILEQTS